MNAQRRTRTRGRALAVLAGVAMAAGLGAAVAAPSHADVVDPDPAKADLRGTVVGATFSEVGQEIALIVTAYNIGVGDSTNWVMTTTLPEQLAPDPVVADTSDDGGTCTVSGRTVTCAGDVLPAGQGFSIRLVLTAAAPGSDIITNTVFGDQEDPNPGNNTDTGVITVGESAALSGDWGASAGDVMAPGTNRNYSVAFTCLSADGCDYTPGMTITDQATNGGWFSPGTNTVFINNLSGIGSCEVTTTEVSCAVTASGRVSQGDVISARTITYVVPGDAPAETQIFAQTLALPSGWVGNDTANDVYPISTPPEVGAPIASWQAVAAVAGLALLGGGAVLLRRRQQGAHQSAV
ncbi:DUF11 domain-containing protein [Occultella gossypii]|uniref:DUF11 domain-containing protein n=1 Tax=Occultella gossypii TaxID=2800820 RepID=A0ABS7S391_9MICO|nr:DUF11 domain-containing protein [Occultella gossypii]MBZ2194793.1 hypothetical protein [Occultella gossypii]